jgi:hypothetical protein
MISFIANSVPPFSAKKKFVIYTLTRAFAYINKVCCRPRCLDAVIPFEYTKIIRKRTMVHDLVPSYSSGMRQERGGIDPPPRIETVTTTSL